MLIATFPQFFTRERITITETEFEITTVLDFRNCTSKTEDSDGDRSNELEEVVQDCLLRQISGNTSELERAEVWIHYLRMSVIVAFSGR